MSSSSTWCHLSCEVLAGSDWLLLPLPLPLPLPLVALADSDGDSDADDDDDCRALFRRSGLDSGFQSSSVSVEGLFYSTHTRKRGFQSNIEDTTISSINISSYYNYICLFAK